MAFAFEKLQVYQKSVIFADNICTMTKDFPRGYYFLGDQLNRAALSISANIAEGNGRFTKPDRHQNLKSDLEEIARMIAGLIKGIEHRKT